MNFATLKHSRSQASYSQEQRLFLLIHTRYWQQLQQPLYQNRQEQLSIGPKLVPKHLEIWLSLHREPKSLSFEWQLWCEIAELWHLELDEKLNLESWYVRDHWGTLRYLKEKSNVDPGKRGGRLALGGRANDRQLLWLSSPSWSYWLLESKRLSPEWSIELQLGNQCAWDGIEEKPWFQGYERRLLGWDDPAFEAVK